MSFGLMRVNAEVSAGDAEGRGRLVIVGLRAKEGKPYVGIIEGLMRRLDHFGAIGEVEVEREAV